MIEFLGVGVPGREDGGLRLRALARSERFAVIATVADEVRLARRLRLVRR